MSNKMLLWREFVRFFLILFRVLLLLGGKSYWERLKTETMWGKALSRMGVIHHVPPHTEKQPEWRRGVIYHVPPFHRNQRVSRRKGVIHHVPPQ